MQMTVFGLSFSAMGILWYARTRSSRENIDAPDKEEEKSWICGIGYLSGIVAVFSVL